MTSVETRRGPNGIDVIVYVIAIAAWSLAILFSSYQLAHEWIIDVPLPHYLAAASAAAAIIALAFSVFLGRAGVKSSSLFILYAATAFYGAYLTDYHLQGRYTDSDALFLTPVFCVVIGVFLAQRCGWRLPRLFLLALVIGFAHFYAMEFAVTVYDDSSSAFKLITKQIPIALDNTMIIPGFVGGIIGAGLSFLGLSFAGRGFRQPVKIILYTLILGAVGAIGLAASESDGSAAPHIWLYPPWQIVFGFMLASLASEGGSSGD